MSPRRLRMSGKIIGATSLLVATSLAAFVVGAAQQSSQIVKALRGAGSEAEMDRAVGQFAEAHSALVHEVGGLLTETKTPGLKVRACFVLGMTRSPQAVGYLIENIAVQADVPERYTSLPLWGRYPCQEALARIGKPAERSLFAVLSRSGDVELRASILKVLELIEGRRGAVLVLEEALERAEGDERKSLEAALESAKGRAPQ
jgi:hypothetical protein